VRSLLFVPGDSPRKLGKAALSGADALILDLEDSVAPEAKGAARRSALAFLREMGGERDRPRLHVRINGFSTGLSDGDLDTVMTGAPDGIVLPKASGGADISLLAARIALREALHDLPDGGTRILAIATETPAAIFGLGTYAGASARLEGLAWGGEDLGAALGAAVTKGADGGWSEPFRLARNLCLFGAAAAGVRAIDTVFTNFRDLDGLRSEAAAAARDGFSGKLAIHPAQVAVINDAFTPDARAVARAERIVEAFARAGAAGVVGLDGEMLDRPHLEAARWLLARAETSERAGGPGADGTP
jgi:citrate lyase subunit beta / citryl-CoA lyase